MRDDVIHLEIELPLKRIEHGHIESVGSRGESIERGERGDGGRAERKRKVRMEREEYKGRDRE